MAQPDSPAPLSQDVIGLQAEAVFEVRRDAIRKFGNAVGDTTPACVQGDIAPPTFPTTFRIPIPGLRYDLARVLHGEQEYRYTRPLRVGDRLHCRNRVSNVYQRDGRLGTMTFLIIDMDGRDESGATVFTGRTTAILR